MAHSHGLRPRLQFRIPAISPVPAVPLTGWKTPQGRSKTCLGQVQGGLGGCYTAFAVDVVDRLLDGGDAFRILIGDLNAEFVFQGHHQFHYIQGISS